MVVYDSPVMSTYDTIDSQVYRLEQVVIRLHRTALRCQQFIVWLHQRNVDMTSTCADMYVNNRLVSSITNTLHRLKTYTLTTAVATKSTHRYSFSIAVLAVVASLRQHIGIIVQYNIYHQLLCKRWLTLQKCRLLQKKRSKNMPM